jgi:beta-glucuronidase
MREKRHDTVEASMLHRNERNAVREYTSLAGIWEACIAAQGISARGNVPEFKSAGFLAVPGSINEQWSERGYRDLLGPFLLRKRFQVPAASLGRDAVLRFASADLSAEVWFDGVKLGSNSAPFLPFCFNLGELISGAWHELLVRVDSRLALDHPLPGVMLDTYQSEGRLKDEMYPPVRYDFFPFSGIHREPTLQWLPKTRLNAPQCDPSWNFAAQKALLSIFGTVHADDFAETATVHIELSEQPNSPTVFSQSFKLAEYQQGVSLKISGLKPWSPESPQRYNLTISLRDASGVLCDQIQRRIGFRSICWHSGQLCINNAPVQLKGFGMHEDFPVLGKAQNLALTVKDFELLRWCGANSFRTSHYPYAEETLELAEELGFMVISEAASVNLDFRHVTDATLIAHQSQIARLFTRDRERCCVIAWSLTNEPGYLAEAAYQQQAPAYFAALFNYARRLDSSRAITAANVGSRHGLVDPLYQHCDILMLNRYLGWYEQPAQLERATAMLREELSALAQLYPGKPMLLSEFGADAIAGMHATTDQLFTEEYQANLIEAYWEVICSQPQLIGGHVWNFADFRTAQHFRRVVMNHKGVFTRTRDPKMAAWTLRRIWKGS